MMRNIDHEARTASGSGTGLFLSLFSGAGIGYWAYKLDPTGIGGSILIIPAIVVVVALVSFMMTSNVSDPCLAAKHSSSPKATRK